MTEIMPVPRNLILLSYQQGALGAVFSVFGFYESNRIEMSISTAALPSAEILRVYCHCEGGKAARGNLV